MFSSFFALRLDRLSLDREAAGALGLGGYHLGGGEVNGRLGIPDATIV